jgi:hypothetical protein
MQCAVDRPSAFHQCVRKAPFLQASWKQWKLQNLWSVSNLERIYDQQITAVWRRCNMSVSTSSALNSGCFKTFLIRSAITVAVRECLSAYAFHYVLTSRDDICIISVQCRQKSALLNLKCQTSGTIRYRVRYQISNTISDFEHDIVYDTFVYDIVCA